MRQATRILGISLLSALLPPASASAWHGKGHDQAARFAVAALSPAAGPSTQPGDPNRPPAEAMPRFFIAGADTIAHCSQDPDVFTRPIAPAQLHNAEAPEHYFDIEPLGGQTPPALRYDFLDLCARNGIKPTKVGLLPYAVTEWTQRLTVALAEYRKWPDDPHVQRKCLVYAGILSHYAADLCQPLHTTIHYDGRAKADGNSPRSGIHNKVDALLGKVKYDEREILKDPNVAAKGELFPAVLEELARSHALVDRVYELEPLLPDIDAPVGEQPRLIELAKDRMRACAAFTASLYLTAWNDSRGIKLPDWHKR